MPALRHILELLLGWLALSLMLGIAFGKWIKHARMLQERLDEGEREEIQEWRTAA